MEKFYQTHNELLSSLQNSITRELKNEINWKKRLIGIKGARGIGKTIFVLDYIKSTFGNSRDCLYVNLNNFYFSGNSLENFADKLIKKGCKTLVLDQVFKYPNWSMALHNIYNNCPKLQVIFTGSPVMRLKEENPDLQEKVTSYHLKGLSFREFLNYQTNNSFSQYALEDLLKNHTEIAKYILDKADPLAHFNNYLQHGFYPFFTESCNFSENVIKVAALTLEVDIPFLQEMELKCFPKIKKLVFELLQDTRNTPNISQLSSSIEISRATVINYLRYLKNARLINMVHSGEADYTKKPERVYLQNSNLLHALTLMTPEKQAVHETFLINQITNTNTILSNGKTGEFLINNEVIFKVGNNKRILKNQENTYILTDNEEVGYDKKIPLWLLGFIK